MSAIKMERLNASAPGQATRAGCSDARVRAVRLEAKGRADVRALVDDDQRLAANRSGLYGNFTHADGEPGDPNHPDQAAPSCPVPASTSL